MPRFRLISLVAVALFLNIVNSGFSQNIPVSSPFMGPVTDIDSPDESHYHDYRCLTIHLLETDQGKADLQAFMTFKKQRKDLPTVKNNPYNEGQTRTWKVSNRVTNNTDDITFTLRKKGDLANIWVENDQFGTGKVTQDVVEEMYQNLEIRTGSFSVNPDTGIIALDRIIFGDPPNVDASGIVQVLVVDVRDGWTPGNGFIAGFFNPADLNTANTNGNGADIIYIDSYPGIYTDEREANSNSALNTLAHEYQHLIHANYGRLITFQNEGQSEFASIATGYGARFPGFLRTPSERALNLYTWRSGNDVLNDYARANLLHSFIAEQIGYMRAGSITRAGSSRAFAYRSALSGTGKTVRDILLDYHITNLTNSRNTIFSYTDPRFRRFRAINPTLTYQAGLTTGTGSRTVEFGAAEYIEFVGVRDMEITLNADPDIDLALVSLAINSSEMVVEKIQPGTHTLNGEFRSVYLVAAKTDGDEAEGSLANYTYSGSWSSIPLLEESYSYVGDIEFFTELPGNPEEANRAGRVGLAVRISPQIDGQITEIELPVNNRETGIRGDATLELIFSRTVVDGDRIIPGPGLDTVRVEFSQLALGTNNIPIPSDQWTVQAGDDVFVQLFLANQQTGDGLELLLDAGSSDETNPNYFPTRTFLYIVPPSAETEGWYRYSDRNNLAFGAKVSGLYTGELIVPQVVEAPESSIEVLETSPFELRVVASGAPEPRFQWFRNDVRIEGATSSTYGRTAATKFDGGSYTVQMTNFAGSSTAGPFVVTIQPIEFALRQNYPNPFNPVTIISFTVARQSEIELAVYDIAGRKIRVLEQGNFTAGAYTTEFNAQGLASGIYMYTLRAGDFTSSKKLTILK